MEFGQEMIIMSEVECQCLKCIIPTRSAVWLSCKANGQGCGITHCRICQYKMYGCKNNVMPIMYAKEIDNVDH